MSGFFYILKITQKEENFPQWGSDILKKELKISSMPYAD